jgi:hypothetical protein
MTPEQAGFQHFSPSNLNKYIASPGLWAMAYLGGSKDGGNPKMWRGTAVEAGFAAYLRKGNLEEAYDAALRAYDTFLIYNGTDGPGVVPQRNLIEPMISQCLLWTPPSDLNATQIEVEHWFDDIPVKIKGFVDLAFEGVDVDLKSTEKCPSKPPQAHVRQVALYRAARQRAGGLLYVTDKRHAYYEVTDEMAEKGLADLHDAARKVTKLLAAFEKPQDILDVLPIDWDHWMAPKQTAPETASVADEFVAVQLEN